MTKSKRDAISSALTAVFGILTYSSPTYRRSQGSYDLAAAVEEALRRHQAGSEIAGGAALLMIGAVFDGTLKNMTTPGFFLGELDRLSTEAAADALRTGQPEVKA